MNEIAKENLTPLIRRFVEVYQSLNANNLHLLEEVYSQDIVFIDPLHRIEGLSRLQAYMKGMYENLGEYGVSIDECLEQEGIAFLQWTMFFSHPKLNKGNKVEFVGTTKLKVEEKIIYHRDFFDAGAMLYQHIPVLGSVIKLINKKAGL